MGRLAALLIVFALATEFLYVATSGLLPGLSSRVAPLLGSLSGSPLLAVGGGAAFVLGVLALGRAREGGRYATREVLLVLSAAAATAFAVGLLLGVVRGWAPSTLASLAAAGLVESLLSAAIAVRLLAVSERHRLMFLGGSLLSAVSSVFHIVLVTLSV